MSKHKLIKEAETQVLCQLYHDKNLYFLNVNLLNGELFHNPFNKKVFVCMQESILKGQAIEMLTIAESLGYETAFDDIIDLFSRVSQETSFRTHLLFLNEYYKGQQLMMLSQRIKGKLEQKEDVFDIIQFCQSELISISNVIPSEKTIISYHIEKLKENIERNFSTKSITGVPTGFRDVDLFTGGWQPSDLIIVAGRPSMGKTALSLTMARNASVRLKNPIAFLSMEMSGLQLASRLAAMESGISSKHILQGKMTMNEIQHLNTRIDELYGSQLFIDECKNTALEYILSACHSLVTVNEAKAIFIDYLQLIKYNKSGQNKEQDTGDICKALKSKAKELNVPIILLCQLTRSTERNADSRPTLSNLRDSGQIEEAADVVSFVYRDEYYRPDNQETKGLAEMIFAKGRNIGIATIFMNFNPELTEFTDLDKSRKLPNYHEPAPF